MCLHIVVGGQRGHCSAATPDAERTRPPIRGSARLAEVPFPARGGGRITPRSVKDSVTESRYNVLSLAANAHTMYSGCTHGSIGGHDKDGGITEVVPDVGLYWRSVVRRSDGEVHERNDTARHGPRLERHYPHRNAALTARPASSPRNPDAPRFRSGRSRRRWLLPADLQCFPHSRHRCPLVR
jgi:hypothetical protein